VSEAVWTGSINRPLTEKKEEPLPRVVCRPGMVVARQFGWLEVAGVAASERAPVVVDVLGRRGPRCPGRSR
jgi:hypothetical protein